MKAVIKIRLLMIKKVKDIGKKWRFIKF